MKRLFSLLVAVTATLVAHPVFAEGVDVTDKLVNPNFDDGITGWNVEFSTKDNVTGYQWLTIPDRNEAYGHSYYGLFAPTLYFESPQGTSPGETSAYQTVKGLPNGVYVVSVIAAFSSRWNDFDARGGYVFAGENQVEGCNNNPWNDNGGTSRYQVASTVIDGTLTLGVRTTEGCTTYCADADNFELWYFGDVKEEDALVEMGKIHMNIMKAATEAILAQPITSDGAEILKTYIKKAESAQTAEEYCLAEDSLRIANFKSKNSVDKMAELTSLLETAKEMVKGEYSEELAVFVAQLKTAVELYEADVKANIISSAQVDTYKADLMDMINQLKVDELYDITDDLYNFFADPSSITEESPLFGITEHPGFGEDEGQYSYEQQAILEELYNEVNEALANFESGSISATEVMSYVSIIKDAVNKCIISANGKYTHTLPFDWIAMPSEEDPTMPNTTNKDINSPYFKNNFWVPATYYGEEHSDGIFRMQTPFMIFDKAYSSITLTVTATLGNYYNANNDGPIWGVQEMYVLDKDGKEIPLTSANFSCNSMRPDGGSSLDGLIDHKLSYNNSELSQFCTDRNSRENRGNHYVTITFPEPITEAQFMFEVYYNDWWLTNLIFSRMTISGYTEAESSLSKAIENASNISRIFGLEPGTYNVDDSRLKALISDANAMLAEGTATEDEMLALADKIGEAADDVKTVPMNKAIDGKEYYISQEYGNQYIDHQGYQKHMTVLNDSILWFADADPSDKNQKWIFTSVEGDDPNDGLDWYTVQNVGTGKYMSTLITGGQAWEPTGEPINWGENYMKLADKPSKLRLEYMDQGQVRIWCMNGDTGAYWDLQAGAHNEGYRTEDPVPYGGTSTVNPNGYGLMGVCGPIIANWWQGGVNSNCSWALHEVVNTLPATIELSNQFGDEARHFATASNTFTFTAEKPCAFENFKAFSCRNGKEISFTYVKSINAISVTFSGNWADFRFSFNNNEGVKTLTISTDVISEEKSAMEKLLEAYNAALQLEYVEGTEIGNIKSLDTFNSAMSTAENLLNNGADETAFNAALENLEEALETLETVQPKSGIKYVIVNGYNATIRSGGPIEYGIYYNPKADAPGWTYLYPDDENYQWQFEAGEDGTWYIRNVATGTYLGAPSKKEEIYGMSETPVSYKVISKGGSMVNIRCVVEGSDETWNIHQKNFNQGFGTFGPLVLYNDTKESRWYIKEVGSYDTNIVVVEDEIGRSAVQGIFDLTGRRVDAPTKGLYIINGQKILIK